MSEHKQHSICRLAVSVSHDLCPCRFFSIVVGIMLWMKIWKERNWSPNSQTANTQVGSSHSLMCCWLPLEWQRLGHIAGILYCWKNTEPFSNLLPVQSSVLLPFFLSWLNLVHMFLKLLPISATSFCKTDCLSGWRLSYHIQLLGASIVAITTLDTSFFKMGARPVDLALHSLSC